MNLWNSIKDAMLIHPNQCVCEDNAAMSYEELVVYAELLAKKLKGEKCCAILCGSEMATAMSLLGCFAAGVTAVPLSSRYGQAHCARILDMIDPTAIITDIGGDLKIMRINNSSYQEPEKHPAVIMCTSGTTGKPKGAMLSEDNILTNLKDILVYFDIDQEDSILISRPLYHCAVLTGEFLVSLYRGLKVHFYSGKFSPKEILDLIYKNRITVFGGTPTMLNVMAKYNRSTKICPLEKICISGECLNIKAATQIVAAFATTADIYHVYGLTEASPRVCWLPTHLFIKYPNTVGYPLRSVQIKILNELGESVKDGEEGVLWIKGGNVMLGYYNDSEQTNKVLKDGWLCTGDIAMKDQYGLLHIKGRNDDLIIRAGMNIYPQEVEETLKSDERVHDVLVYKYISPYSGVQIGMKICGDFKEVSEVKNMCSKLLPSFQIPSRIELVSELTISGTGKIIRSVEND